MRYTIKNGEGLLVEPSSEYLLSNDVWYGDCIQKLGELEDILENHKIKTPEELDGLLSYLEKLKNIEEELGLPLKIYLKLRYDTRIYYKDGKDYYINAINKDNYIRAIRLNTENNSKENSIYVALCDYGKTWALTKEELL